MFENACKKESDQDIETIQNQIIKVCPQNATFYIKTATEWLNSYQDGLVLGCETNRIGDTVLALYHNHVIYLLGETYKTIMYAPKLMFHFVDGTHIHIDDVLMKHNNVGNGSIVMRALFQYAKINDVKIITGSLSCVDQDHKSRRNHYYHKFGFTINDRSVVKQLKER